MQSLKKALTAFVYILAAVCLCVFSTLNFSEYKAYITDIQNSNGTPLTVGDKLNAFDLTDFNDKPKTVSEKPYIAVIAIPGCPYVAQTLENINADGGINGVQEVRVIYFNYTKKDYAAVSALKEQFKGFGFYKDKNNSLKWQLKTQGYPTVLIIDNGLITYKNMGYNKGVVRY